MEGIDAVTTGLVVTRAARPSTSAAGWPSSFPVGTYDVSVQFRATSGSVNVRGRKLWVRAEGF